MTEQSEGIRFNRRCTRSAETTIRVSTPASTGISAAKTSKIVSGVLPDYLESDGELVYDGWTTAVGLRAFC